MPLNQQEIRERSIRFTIEWADESRERAEAQTFWNEFFNVFGITRRRLASFEEPVRLLGDRKGSIDLFWKGTLIAEHKSKGKDLTKAYGQALDYFPGIREEELPRYVIVSDFSRFCLYDLEADQEFTFSLKELPDYIHLFGFISGYTQRTYRDEDPVNIRVAEKMGELHDALLESGYGGHALEVFLVRLVYCLFADDTGIFPKDQFHYVIESRTRENGADVGYLISSLFQLFNTPFEQRQRNLDEELQLLPYVNGQLFSEVLPIPVFDGNMRRILLDCCSFNWSRVSPAIFGSLFQSVMDRDARRAYGAHYTSERNILKVVHGLFLDDLIEEFERIKQDLGRLRQFHKKLSMLRFFDPACGCGNFLVITYREIRRLEIAVIREIRRLANITQLSYSVSDLSVVDVDMLYGIEIEEFPCRIAEVALWLTDHQMNMELSQEFGIALIRLPLRKSANIHVENALRVDWATIVPQPAADHPIILYVLGNPPFRGKQFRNHDQNDDMRLVCGNIHGFGVLDYVTAWYVKAAQLIKDTTIKVAFVSTNSITQGEQVGILWSWLLAEGVKIHFAHRTFVWSNEARGQAAVFVVIIGFGMTDVRRKRLFDYAIPHGEPSEIIPENINPYLVDSDNVIALSRQRPICFVPPINFGSMPNDGGFLLLSDQEKEAVIEKEPGIEKYIHPFIGTDEFLYGRPRWCFWLKGTSPAERRNHPEIMRRLEQVRNTRLQSPRPATRKFAQTPYLFGEDRQPVNRYLLIPGVTSERRTYVPMDFSDVSVIASNLVYTMCGADLYHFGVLSSAMHMAWMRQVCGRLEGRYRYSAGIVYNNFPWPEQPEGEQIARVERSARAVFDARALYTANSLADLYDPLSMPKELIDAHHELDIAVDKCYRPAPFISELNRLKFLFGLYNKYTEPLLAGIRPLSTRRR